ncbi:MAG: lytic murein transglycosylase [Devosiaceae bacterium]|nr:lytic murein transglycosylase [Devosiaceae bacterium]
MKGRFTLLFNWIFRFFYRLIFSVLILALGIGGALSDPSVSFEQFIKTFETKALQNGISAQTYQRYMGNIELDPKILERISAQPEFTTPIWEYIETRVSDDRIGHGVEAIAQNRELFTSIASKYGVDPFLLAAIWGIETNYGAVLKNRSLVKPIIPSLASLVFADRGRVLQDEKQLIAALKLVQGGAEEVSLVGSWAGALGHLQVLPSVILASGVDGDADGIVDVNLSLVDALATSASLLKSFGYESGVDWGYEVKLPDGFDYAIASQRQMRPVEFFANLGVERVAGREFIDLEQGVFLYVPAGSFGPKFLMTGNYLVLKSYNASDSYALAVAHLSDRLKGSGSFISDWPRQAEFPNREQRIQIQQSLADLGYYEGRIDSFIGPATQAAYQKFQLSRGLVPDGFVTLEALELLGQ